MVLAEQQKQLGDDALSYWKAEVDFEDAAAAILQKSFKSPDVC